MRVVPSVNYAGSLGGQRIRKRKAYSFRFCASETGTLRDDLLMYGLIIVHHEGRT